MISHLRDQASCTGCAACMAVCGVHAIVMVPDAEGFLCPVIDADKCVSCGQCESVCPINNVGADRRPRSVWAAKARDDELRSQSSSGGLFSLIAKQILQRGGVVFGAGFERETWAVSHVLVDSEKGLSLLRGSKYVQSDLQKIYPLIRTLLEQGREVLVSGTPCQIAGVRSYLFRVMQPGTFEHLLTLVDFVCHAVPSPLAWQRYLEDCDVKQSEISEIFFRDKTYGWRRYCLNVKGRTGGLREQTNVNAYLRGFLRELYNRPSCSKCTFRFLRSGADITLADYWSPPPEVAALDDDKGLSLVLVNTQHGENCFHSVVSQCEFVESSFEDACRVNPALVRSFGPHPNRSKFFKKVMKCDFSRLVFRLLQPSFKDRLKDFLVRVGRSFNR